MTVFNLHSNSNGLGELISIESLKDIPFEIKRVFYIFNVDINSKRGNHAHFLTKQCLISISGSCTIFLDNGLGFKKEYVLDSPKKYLLQDTLVWGSMYNFSKDNILLVLANTNYSEKDYIKTYDQFLKVVTTKYKPDEKNNI